MPTRVVWDKSTPGKRTLSPSPRLRQSPAFVPTALTHDPFRRDEPYTSTLQVVSFSPSHQTVGGADTDVPPRTKTKRRSIIDFRSSLLRELSVRSVNEELSSSRTDDEEVEEETLRLSSDDIRASPRMLGYLFAMVAAGVQLVSVLQYV
jgi:hypothetical protein